MGGWIGRYILFIYYLHFYIYKLRYVLINFFGLPKFLFNLTSQRDHFMVNQKNH
jgi:hypothetical protein